MEIEKLNEQVIILSPELKPSIKLLKEIRETINELDTCEQVEILKILEKNKVKYTSNNNGVFINMNKLSMSVIEDIEKFIKFIKNNYKKNLI